MRVPAVAVLILAVVSCGGEKKSDEGKPMNDESKKDIRDRVATVDVRYRRGKVTLTVPAYWIRANSKDEKIYGPTWRAPERPSIATYRQASA